MKARNTATHPWHLTRCSSCRRFVISSAPQCPNCGTWRASARAVRFAIPVIGWVAVVAACVLAFEFAVKIERQRIMLQDLATAAQPSK